MYDKQKTLLFLAFFLPLFFITIAVRYSFAQESPTPTSSLSITPTPDNSAQVSQLQQQISDYESKISDLQNQENTLSSQIAVMDSQMAITKLRLNSVKEQILSLTEDIQIAKQKVSVLETSLNDLVKVLLNRVVATYESGSAPPIEVLFSSSSMSDFMSRANYLRIAQDHDKSLIYNTQQAKSDYANQKGIFEDKKKKVEALQVQLASYTTQLQQEKVSEQSLLDETNNSEENYQKLLADAQAQLAGFSQFAQSHGGASILANQTYCDGWGCYYNQRDSQWAGNSLNGTSYTLGSDGCLITSMAMVMTHYNHKTTPQDINSNSGNFASYNPAYLLYTISANGATATRQGVSIDSTLSGGDPVIVGIRYSSGDTHFVVLKSGSNGNYVMNDPWTPNGHDLNFSSYYSVGSIYEVDKVVML